METVTKQIYDAYIPMDRRVALSMKKDIPEIGEGSLLFADISGFTSLTNELAKELGAQRGADEITRYLNIIYEAIIGQIHQYMGSVISFAGDAIICWFDKDEGRRALAAGFNIKNLANDLAIKHNIPVQIKLVISSGQTKRYVAGNPDIQLFDLLVGDLISKLIQAEKKAKAGDLLISNDLAEKYKTFISTGKTISTEGGKFIQLTDLKENTPATPWWINQQLENEVISQWLLSPVFEKIQQGEERFLAELRLAVCLFLKFEGIDFDNDPQCGYKINDYISRIQTVLDRFDGHLLQVIIGDKGDYLYIGFGALTSHEDDATRALETAHVLKEVSQDCSYIKNVQIGITLGPMFAGPYGSSNRRTYSMIGSSANLAARLMEKAIPWQILLTNKVVKAAQNRFEFEDLGQISFKGLEKQVKVNSLIGLKDDNISVIQTQLPLVGRKKEIEQILEYAKKVVAKEDTGVIILQGEGGSGKSRIISEVSKPLNGLNLNVVTSYANSIEASTPYFILRELARQILNVDQLDPGQIDEEISSLIRSDKPELKRMIPLLKDILPLDLEDNNLISQMSGQVRAGNLYNLLVEIFSQKIKNDNILIILDDAHWIDSASWSFLKILKESIPKIGFIISSRTTSGIDHEDYQDLLKKFPVESILLGNLNSLELDKLLSQIIGVEHIPDDVSNMIFDITSGHPFFSEELTYALLESETIVVENGQCRLVNLDYSSDQSMPNTIQRAITSRLDRMALPHQLSIKVASILGRLFVLNAVHGIHPSPPQINDLRVQMDNMTRMNLIKRHLNDPELSYSFKQSIIHSVAYNMLSFSQRYELHQKAALWYERFYSENLSQHFAQLAYHWQQAEVYYKAVDYYEKAALDAISKGAYRDGIIFIDQTLSLSEHTNIELKRKAKLLIEKGISYFKIGEIDKAQTTLIAGIRILKKPAPSSFFGMSVNLMRQSIIQFFNRIRSKEKKSPNRTKRDLFITLSRGYEYLAQSYFHHNKLFFSLQSSLSCLNIAEKAGPSSQLARAYGSLCVPTTTMPIPGLGEIFVRLTKAQLSEDIGLEDHGRILEFMGVALSGEGRWKEVDDLCSKALEMAEEIGDRFLIMENTCILAACKLYEGKIEESEKLRRKLLEIGQKDKAEIVQGWANLQLAEISLHFNRNTESNELLIEARRFEKSLGQPDRLWLNGMLAGSYFQLSMYEEAQKYSKKALKLANQSLPTSFFALEGYSGMAMAAIGLMEVYPDDKGLSKLAKQSLKAFSSFASTFPIGQARYHYWHGKKNRIDGNEKKALKHWQRGIQSATDLNMELELSLLKESIK